MTIWKFPPQNKAEQAISAPVIIEPLCVQIDPCGQLCMWALVDPQAEKISMRVYIFGTGHDGVNSLSMKYVGTCQTSGYVWHVFVGRFL